MGLINNLIAEKLPVTPATSPVGAPEIQSAPEKQVVPPSERRSIADIAALVENGQLREADQAFEEYLASRKEGRFKSFLPYYYLWLKAVKGDTASVERLRTAVLSDSGNVDARIELASYYSHFDRDAEAARLLLEGVPSAPADRKSTLLRNAAEALADSGDHQAALSTLLEALIGLENRGELKATFQSVATVAKKIANQDLESAALERILVLDPSDAETRFRLAYLYSELGNDRLAVYHYQLRLSQGRDPIVLNNLGVAFGSMKITGKEVEMFEAASAESPLAKANLSHAYVDRGFLSKAEELARAVLTGEHEDLDRGRAAGALQRLAAKRAEEISKEHTLTQEAKAEATFRAEYAEAHIGKGEVVSGAFSTPHGVLIIHQEADRLIGNASLTEESPVSLYMSLAVPGREQKRMRTRLLKLVARVTGRAGPFTLTTEVTEEGGLWSIPETSEIEGLLMVARDGRAFDVLEKGKDGPKIYTARLV